MDEKTLLLLIPVAIIQAILMIVALVNVIKKSKTKYLNKPIWIALIIFVGYVGSIGYLLVEGGHDDSDQSE